MKALINLLADACTNPRHSAWVCVLLFLADTVLSSFVIENISYTEIDWSTYMQQIFIFLKGERDYTLIRGSTGPLVYPAGHVYIYTFLYYMTEGGRDIGGGQLIFVGLYLLTLALVMASYQKVNAPLYIYPLLVVSKRLHSIFMLRMFNDGFAALFLWATIFLLQKRKWSAAVIFWSAGVSVKMTLLLVAPGLAVILILALGFPSAVCLGVLSLLIQIGLAIPFLQNNPSGYFSRAFEFTRQFLFKWTVNWRFIGEHTFLSKNFSLSLLILHLSLLLLFAQMSWLKPSGKSPIQFAIGVLRGQSMRYKLSASFITKTMLTSLAIGLLCARSLHYQFFAYLAWVSPILLWEAAVHPVLIVVLCLLQEWAWNVYPSTPLSSGIVVACLACQVLAPLFSGSGGHR